MSDFPITRSIIEHVGDWANRLARMLPSPVRVTESNGEYHWEFPQASASALQVAKSVRMVSGIRAALLLADNGFVMESASILRMVSDFSVEITAVGEGLQRGHLTKAQKTFVDQFFEPPARTREEYETQEKQFYVSRADLLKSEVRLANDASVDGERLLSLRRFVNKGYDSYVHGAYLTAMELYHGGTKEFEVAGTAWQRTRCVAKTAVAGKLHEVLVALEYMAALAGNSEVHAEVRAARHRLDASNEQSLGPCADIP